MEMKLCAIYNVWNDYQLFIHSAKNIRNLVDGVILVHGERSNFGQKCNLMHFQHGQIHDNFYHVIFEPTGSDARENETAKRNLGLQMARELGYTHFLIMDSDEFYEPGEFIRERKRMEDDSIAGLVCRVKCYFRSPSLTIGYDTTLVPFIHKLTPSIRCDFNRNYPFAWSDRDGEPFTAKKRIRIDPTRSLNINSGVVWSEITMHHMSWIRKDIKKKVRNSTARTNLERSTIFQDYLNAKEGYFCQFYGKTLERSPNIFGLPDIYDTSLSESVPATGSGGSSRPD